MQGAYNRGLWRQIEDVCREKGWKDAELYELMVDFLNSQESVGALLDFVRLRAEPETVTDDS